MSNQAPCIYPGCDDGTVEHQPCKTKHGFCNHCRKRYGKLLGWLVEDYHAIKQPMPSPVRRPGDGAKHMSPKSKTFGHPAEWASDAARMIVDRFNALDDDLREHRKDRPVTHRSVEVYRLSHSYDYVTKRFNDLCTFPLAQDWAEILVDMHGKLRANLGLTRFVQRLKTPCPECDVKALVRSLAEINCENCGRTIPEEHYLFYARILLDEMIKAYDTQSEADVADECVAL